MTKTSSTPLTLPARLVSSPTGLSWIIGTPETILSRLEALEDGGQPLKLNSEEFGSVFVANELERLAGTIEVVDSIVPPGAREKGPSVGEYFFYAWANRQRVYP